MRYRSSYRRRRNSSKSAWIIILGLMVGAGAYMFSSPSFEREDPIIKSKKPHILEQKRPT